MSSLSSQAHRAESPCFKHLPKHWLTAILGTAAVLLVLLACWQHRQGYDAVNFQSRKSTHLRNVRAAETPSLIRREQFPDSQSLVPTVPHIIHQIYMQGSSELLKSAMRPGTSFRKEWWSSCKVHHPGWSYMLWDKPACEQLLRDKYPWFLDTWGVLGNGTYSIALQSDAIRPFILHAYGGVHLDLDTECFCSMEPWLKGAQLVFMAEGKSTVPNPAQMASTRGHHFWLQFFQTIQANVATGQRNPLYVAGPAALRDLVRKELNNTSDELPGAYKYTDGSNVVVYGPQQWFSPCNWDEEECHVSLARNKPAIMAASRKVSADHTATDPSQDATHHAPMLNVKAVAGVHHFAGSWLKAKPGKGADRWTEGVLGVVDFLTSSGDVFVEAPCKELRMLGLQTKSEAVSTTATAAANTTRKQQRKSRDLFSSNPQQSQVASKGSYSQSPLRLPVTKIKLPVKSRSTNDSRWTAAEVADNSNGPSSWSVCWDPVKADLSRGSCLIYIVKLAQSGVTAAPTSEDGTLLMARQLEQSGCEVHHIAPDAAPSDGTGAVTADNLTMHRLSVGSHFDPFADPPAHTMDSLRDELGHNNKSLTLVHLSDVPLHGNQAGGSNDRPHAGCGAGVLDLFNSLYVGNSKALARVKLLNVQMSVPQRQDHHKAYTMYQHIYQEQGFMGYDHRSSSCNGALSTAIEACCLQLDFWNRNVL